MRQARETEKHKQTIAGVEMAKYKKKINKEVGKIIEEKVKGICHRKIGGSLGIS